MEEYSEILDRSLKNSLLRHTWYLVEDVVIVLLADPNVYDKEKTSTIQKLMKYPYPEDISYFDVKKPGIRGDKNSQLHELVGKNCWYLIFILNLSKENILSWVSNGAFVDLHPSFKFFKNLSQTSNL